jgi:predicted esterase
VEHEGHEVGRLAFRLPVVPAQSSSQVGLGRLDGPAGEPLGLAYVPPPEGSAARRLVVLLHGAGGSARQGLEILLPVADEHQLLLAAPQSAGRTWDFLRRGYGPDVRRIDGMLERFASEHRVSGLSIAGFSDGASYALSLGITNGDVVDSVIAFSPGFAAPEVRHGSPRLFVSHGISDAVLPIDRCSRRLVPTLQRNGYSVAYEEFDGGHEFPGPIVERAMHWLTEAG